MNKEKNMNETLKGIAIAVVLIGAFGLVGTMDLEDEIKQDEHYCHMRSIWEANKHIDAAVRPGWPNYKPEIKCL
jgi:hypothetical protein